MARAPRTVLVTGANSGIGLASVLELAGAGYTVTGTVRSADKAEQVHEAAAARGVRVDTVLLDVADPESVQTGWAEVADRTDGGPWALVNNAGTAQAGPVEDVPDERARAQLEVNLLGPARLTRLALPAMRARGEGRIVNVTSIAGRVSTPMMGWYCASKAGLEALSDALRVEVAPHGVKVVLIEPGTFGTNIWAAGGAGLPEPPPESPYAEAYARSRRVTGASGWMPDPVWVARVIRLALASPRPLPRYLVGLDAMGALVGDRLAPTAVADRVKAFASGLRRLPLP